MDMSIARQILTSIPKLQFRDIPKIKQALNALEALGGSGIQEGESPDWLLLGIALYLTKRGTLSGKNAIYQLQKRRAYKQYREKLPAVMGYLSRIEVHIGSSTRARPQLAFLAARALADLMTDWKVFGVTTMLSQIDKIPEALERAYPGYIAAGLFGFVLNRERNEQP